MSETPPHSNSGQLPLTRLVDTRLQLHHAVQLLTAFAQAYVPPLPDDQHRSLAWDEAATCLRTRPAGADTRVTASLDVTTFVLQLERDGRAIEAWSLGGHTRAAMRDALGLAAAALLAASLRHRHAAAYGKRHRRAGIQRGRRGDPGALLVRARASGARR